MIRIDLVSGGNASEPTSMNRIAELLERKRFLLARKQDQTDRNLLAVIQHDLREIDAALTRLEMEQVPPTAPE